MKLHSRPSICSKIKWIAVFLLLIGMGALAETPTPLPSISPSPAIEASIQKFGFFQLKKLEYQFSRAQSVELESLRHRQRAELNELKQAQKSQFNEWFEKEKIARREFFKIHPKGEDRRTYLHDFKTRRIALLKLQEEERARRFRENEVRLKSAKEDQLMRGKEFREHLAKGERPPASLWPQNHY